jgi:hypothetical protein
VVGWTVDLELRLTLLGIGAMASKYRPAGLLVEYGRARVLIDGGPKAARRAARRNGSTHRS